MKSIIMVVLAMLTSQLMYAQRTCGSTAYNKSHPIVPGPVTSGMYGRDTTSNEIINIPVVIHVVYKGAEQNISDAQILSQIDVLNKDFRKKNPDAINIPAAFKRLAADTRINFCLARVDPTGHLTSGIVRKYTSLDYFNGDDAIKFSSQGGDNAWNSKQYLNIWVCKLFGRSLGYATSPGTPADKDGVVINYDVFGTVGSVRAPFDKGRTATHEIGHWLGLRHIWGDEDCGDDGVDDTPTQLSYNYNCPNFPRISPCSPNSAGDMFMNFMDFVNDACMFMFTTGQKSKMRAVFSSTGVRNSFLASSACDSSHAIAGGPVPETPVAKPTEVLPAVADEILFYPNPVNDILHIESKEKVTLLNKTVKLFNLTGKLISQTILQGSSNQVNFSGITRGIYFMQVGDGDNKKIFKVVKL